MKRLSFIVTIVFSVMLFASFAFAQNKANIKILATGGTIAGAAKSSMDTTTYKSAVTAVDALIENVPEMKTIANVSGEQISQIGSQDMTDEVWLKLAKRVNELLAMKDVDGVVITHGTDTMEETAYFLNLVVKSNKPVVLVGAMRPGTAISADGPMNMFNAVAVAAHPTSKDRGVMVVMTDTIHGARDVSKTNTMLVDTFTSLDYGALGYVVSGEPMFLRNTTRLHTTKSEFDISKLTTLPQVDIVYGYADTASAVAVKAFVENGSKGIINAGVGNGSIFFKVLPVLKDARSKGVVIVRSSRTGSGVTTRGGELSDNENDFIASESLNPQKSRVLLKLILTKVDQKDSKKIQEMFGKY